MKKIYLLLLFLPFFFTNGFSANDSVRTLNYDTNYIAKYPLRMIIGLYQSARHYDILLEQFVTADTIKGRSNANYFADANNVSGFSFDFDLIGFSFGYNSVPTYSSEKVGKTTYYSYGLNFSTKGLRVENSIKSYKGFYDKHSPVYDSLEFSDSTKYFQNPSMTVFTYKTKAIYIFKKKKFSLSSCYANTARQLKSSATWLLIGNVYGLKMHADSSLVPRPIQPYYGTVWDDMNQMNVIGFSGGGGLSGTLVLWKKLYVNFLLGAGLEAQHRLYTTLSGDGRLAVWQPSFAADWRASAGYNGKKFFIRVSNVIDFNYFYTSAIHITQQYYSGEFSFGYRFYVKTPKVYKKFMESEVYQKYF